MLDIKFIRENPDVVKENIKKKFQDQKLPLVDEVIELDAKRRAAIVEADQLRAARNSLSKKIGMLMMSKIGGSSGVLYGGAYMNAARSCAGKETLTNRGLCRALDAMVTDMMARGKAEPGMKTMIDALYPAVQAYKAAIESGKGAAETLAEVKKAAIDGAEATRGMEAVKGRASYQTNKGVGHLDAGAVTMSYQIECLCDYIAANLI